MDKNVILRLYYAIPYGETTTDNSMQKCAHYCRPRRSRQPINDGVDNDRRERAQTRKDETPAVSNEDAFDGQPYIEFRFDTVRRHPQGFLVGADPGCDFQLLGDLGLSSKHLCITFDDKKHLVVKDLRSANGTVVSYSDKIPDRRCHFTWIIGGIDQFHEEAIEIQMGFILKLKAFINHAIFADDGSASLIDQFRSQMTDEDIPYTSALSGGEDLSVPKWRDLYTSANTLSNADIHGMLLKSRGQTATATEMHTPSTRPLYLDCNIGMGSFGQATRWINMSTGKDYVEKTPIGNYDAEKWENEISIMQRLGEHENIVPLLHYVKVPQWTICLPYYELGSLEKIWKGLELTLGHVMELLKQCLAGLKHAHAKHIAHRDMKLSNILVESLTPFRIRLADFGESKATNISVPQSYCGTEIYMAPEVIKSRSNWGGCYSIVCDLWSLGAMLSEVLFGKPQWPRNRAINQAYCDAVREQTQSTCEADLQDLQRFLLQNLLVVDPKQRPTAAACYELAMALPPVNEPSRIMTCPRRATSLPTEIPACSKTPRNNKEGDPVQSSGLSTIRPLPGHGSKRRLEDDAEAGQESPGPKRPFAGKMLGKRLAELRPVPVGDVGAVSEKPVPDGSDQTAPSDQPSLPAGASGAGSTIREPQPQLSKAEPAHRRAAVTSARPGSPVHPAVSPVPQSPVRRAHDVRSANRNSPAREPRSQVSGAESTHRGPAVASARTGSPVPQSSERPAHDVLSANRNSTARKPRS
ncbi:Serine/threonine-protein kinase [Beauveria bassiana]|nr:Serine/threonine-protein kinase [Beauveria bassiana]